jgi:pimeloyl-ACP methyl ester carboxylesterase
MASTGSIRLDDGQELAYRSIGDESKPLLLFVAGSSGLGSVFHRLAERLSTTFRCVYYDKRGFVSTEAGQYEDIKSLNNTVVTPKQHADDAASLIKHLSPSSPAYVFGTSLGGTAVLDLTVRYPKLVHTAILHEPIIFSVIRDLELRGELNALYQRVGNMVHDPHEAFRIFEEYMYQQPKDNRGGNDKTTRLPRRPNSPSAVELFNLRQSVCEALPISDYILDEQAAHRVIEKLILVCGVDSGEQQVSKPVQALAAIFSPAKRLRMLTGDHNSFAGRKYAARFAQELSEVLVQEGRQPSPPQQKESLSRL